MSVPEAAVDKHSGPVTGKNNIGRSGKVAPMQAEAIAGPKKHHARQSLGSGVLAPDGRHNLRAFFGSNSVDHIFLPAIGERSR